MKKFPFLSTFLLVGIIFAFSSSCFAQAPTDRPGADVDGNVWMNSSQVEKESFLFGASSAIVLEYHARLKHSEEPSRLVRGWVEALKDMPWRELSRRIDQYYNDNPGKIHRHVFEVIWHEIIVPNWKK
ncbi:MAG: hypothetical protein HQL37_11140 [Alphaproteobacteria bacterium]|nr:hypothetical protein [Desulfovibrionaceae bacterium]MBF0514416.1 hypothetical protein [Desulfovibrionaceae bacterium]MBF0562553.1 hypothetical protein [Alphaproteobacteria bacterium]